MKKTAWAVTCALCGMLLGAALTVTLYPGGFNFPGQPPVQNAEHTSAAATRAQKTESTTAPGTTPSTVPLPGLSEHSDEPTAATENSALSGTDQFDFLNTIRSNSSIAELQRALSIIAGASLDEVNVSLANITANKNRIYEHEWIIGLLTQRKIELDPVGTLQQIDQLSIQQGDRLTDNMASYALIEHYARLQPDLFIEWLSNLSEDTVGPDQLMMLYSALALSAPEPALELFMRNRASTSDRYGGPEMIIYAWADKDPLAALQWLEQQDDQQLLDHHVESIISQLASRDREAARVAAARFPELVSEDLLVLQDVQTLAETDPLGAIEMAESLTDSGDLDNAMLSIYYTWGAKDPVAALEHIASIVETEKREWYTSHIGESLSMIASRSPAKRQELLNWSESLPPDMQTTVRDPILSEWASYDPEAAIAWLESQGGWTEHPRLIGSIAWHLPEHNIDKALEVFANVDQESQMAMTQGIIEKLYRTDPQSAWNWYEGLPENAAKQASLFGLVMLTATDNPHQAMDLAYSVNDVNNPEMITGVIQTLSYEYPEAVKSWLATANMDEQRKTELNAMINQTQRTYPGMFNKYDRYMPVPDYGTTFYRMER